MGPYPEELDVFTVPHSRMKNLVHKYNDMLHKTNFSNGREFEFLLNNLRNTFNEFRCHERIENKYIMKKLKHKLKELSIRNAAVCNCHKDNQLKQLVMLFQDAADWRRRSRQERINYGIKLRNILEDFTQHFLPHMKEEEEVFQPLLMKYFTYEELRCIKDQVISEHENWNWKYGWDEKRFQESDETEEDDDLCGDDVTSTLPPEILVKIFKYLCPVDLCRAAQVNKHWNQAAMDQSLWREISPVQWAKGDWRWSGAVETDEETSETSGDDHCADVYIKDEDADLDESGDSDSGSQWGQAVSRIKRECEILQSLSKSVLPRVGGGVRKLNLAHSRSLTNGGLYRILKLCPNIEYLDLTQTKISDFGFRGFVKSNGGMNLRTVILSGCGSITDKTLDRLFSGLGSRVHGSGKTDKTCTKSCSCDDNIYENTVTRNDERLVDSNVVFDGRTSGSSAVCRLEVLNLSGCHKITDVGLRHVGHGLSLPRLRYVDLSGLPDLTCEGLDRFVDRCPSLSVDQLFYCDNVMDSAWADTANGCQNVECPSRACCRHVYRN